MSFLTKPSIPISLAWIAVVMLVCQKASLRRWTGPLAAVGRTALSNYVLQTVICTTIFYGHGLGYFGQVERFPQAIIVVLIWVFQIMVSVWWLQRFRFGPLEWAWRCLVYLRWQPLRR